MTAQARLLGGRYQVGELLGYGGMAEVHRGRDLRLGRDVAIKMLRTDLARDNTFQMRFRREAQNAASLNHPAIVSVYDTGEEIAPTGETLPFIVMEFVNGRTLKEVLTAEGRLMPRRALEIVADICAALEFSHRHGIIHRDIKPGNVMMTQNGQVKVMDFGIARALASGASTMTQTSAVIGTAQYLSPEQARGESVDARSDVYAAGCVLFELVVGHPPFVGDSPVSVAYQHVREDPSAPSDHNPEVSGDLDAIVLKALAKNPLNRYQSAGEMRADLLRSAAGRPVLATPVLRDDNTVALPPTGRQTGVTRAIPASVAGGQRKRSSPWLVAALSALAVLLLAGAVAWILLNQDEGTESVAVPDVLNKTQEVAEEALTTQNLQFTYTEPDESAGCEQGTITKQDPVAGAKAEPRDTVTLTACTGPSSVEVPENLVGNTQDLVEKTLDGLGLVPKIEEIDSDKPAGIVVEVPQAGETVKAGSDVVVRVSNNKLVQVPDVVGESRSDAVAILERAGFTVREVAGASVGADEGERVTKQTPDGNSSRPKGDRVTITYTVPLEQQEPPEETEEPEPTPTPTVIPTTSPSAAAGG